MQETTVSTEQLELALKSGRVTVWNWDIVADRVSLDPHSAVLPGTIVSTAGYTQKDWLAAVHPDDRQRVKTELDASVASGRDFESSFRAQGGEAGWQWLGVRAGVRKDAAGNAVEMAGVSVEITEQREREQRVAEREEFVSALVNSIDGIVWEADAKTFQFLFVSQRAERILGFPIADWLEPGFWVARLHPDDAQWCVDYCKDAVRSLKDHDFEYRMLARDGRVVWLHDSVSVQGGSDGAVRLRGIMVDVTARKEAEQARRESEALLNLLFEQSPAGMAIFDEKVDKIRVNAAYCRFVGQSEQEIMSGPMQERVHPEDHPLIDRIIADLNQGRPVDAELRFVRPDGEVVWGRLIAVRSSVEGRLLRGLSIIEDITAQKRADELLKTSNETFRAVANDTPAMLWMSSSEGKVTFSNRAVSDFLGTPAETPGFDRFDLVHPDDVVRSLKLFDEAVRNHTPVVNESRLRRFDGEYRWLLNHYVPCFSETGEFLGHIGIATDITQRKQAEEQLQAAFQTKARLERELSGLSERLIRAQEEERRRVARDLHDSLGNQVAALTLSLSASRQSGSTDTRPMAKLLGEMAQTIREISHQLHPVMLEYAGLAAAVRELCREFTAMTKIKVVVVEPEGELPNVPPEVSLGAYRVIQEALQNIAKHSGASSAIVTLACQGGQLRLNVSDRGVGFDAKAEHRGLGLISIRERVRLLGGTVEIDSAPNDGTAIRVSIPCPNC